jgi:poly(3-hydroxybutyrate) depolymerase
VLTPYWIKINRLKIVYYFFCIILPIAFGCAVPQPPGRGSQFTLQQPEGNRQFYLYLPEGYTAKKTWPLVVTLHGMKPFDSAPAQAEEWQSTADQFGFVVIAPVLINSDLFMQYPLKDISAGVKEDEKDIIDIIRYVTKRCNIDSKRIFATSWSSGGYLLHYIVNRHPDLFAAICARGSCFSEEILNVDNARRMAKRGFPVMIYYCENDLSGIRNESQRAIEWYRSLGFSINQRIVPGRGHERVPELAANFFSKNTAASPIAEVEVPQVEIEASSTVGVAPFTINLLATLPGVAYNRYHTFKFFWYIDGVLQDQAQGTGKRMLFATIYTPGEHKINVEVVPNDGRKKIVNTIQVRVLPSMPNL